MKSQLVWSFLGWTLLVTFAIHPAVAKKPGKAEPVDGKKFYYPKGPAKALPISVNYRRQGRSVVSKSDTVQQQSIVYQNYHYDNFTGTYLHELKFSDNSRRTEIGGYINRQNKQVYIIRGFYSHILPDSDYENIEVYIIDDQGYHSIPYPPSLPAGGFAVPVGLTPAEDGSQECGFGIGDYSCIDPLLLKLLVG